MVEPGGRCRLAPNFGQAFRPLPEYGVGDTPDRYHSARRWVKKPGGLQIVAYEWARFKRVVRLDRTSRQPCIKVARFRALSHRLRDDAVGPIHLLVGSWSHRLSDPFPARVAANKVRQDFPVGAMVIGAFYTARVAPDSQDFKCFVILRAWSGGEKYIDVGEKQDMRDRVLVQTYDIWRKAGGDYPPTTVTVAPTLEASSIALWQVSETWLLFRGSLRRWETSVSDTSGCIDVHTPQEINIDLASPKCPVVCLLESLHLSGWRPVDSVVTHRHGPKEFSSKSAATRREYLQVLALKWDNLEQVSAMRSDGPRGYYLCLLKGYTVPARQKAKFYSSVLAANGALPADGGKADESQAGCEIVQLGGGWHVETQVALEEDAVDGGGEEDQQESEADAGEVGSSGSSSSSRSRSPSGDAVEADDPDAAMGGNQEVVQEMPDARYPAAVDGAPVKLDDYHGPEQRYCRLILKCQHHRGCERKHNTGLRQTATFGEREPVAFLAVWHQAGRGIPRIAHRDFYPSLEQMAEWLADNP